MDDTWHTHVAFATLALAFQCCGINYSKLCQCKGCICRVSYEFMLLFLYHVFPSTRAHARVNCFSPSRQDTQHGAVWSHFAGQRLQVVSPFRSRIKFFLPTCQKTGIMGFHMFKMLSETRGCLDTSSNSVVADFQQRFREAYQVTILQRPALCVLV